MSVQERIAISRPTMAYSFFLANLAATQTGTAVPVPGAAVTNYLLPFGGYIVCVVANLTAAFSAGTAVIDITLDGTSTKTINIGVASTTEYITRLPIPDEPFSAGQELAVTYTTDGSASPTTNDLEVTVYVCFSDFTF